MYTYTFKPTWMELYLANFHIYTPVYKRRLFIYLAIGVISLLCALFFNEWRFFHYVLIGLAILFTVSILLDPLATIIHRKDLYPDFNSETTIGMNDEGLATVVGGVKNQVPWQNISDIIETRHFIMLHRDSYSAFFLPKRIFKNSGEQHQVLEFIKSKAS